MTPSAPAEMSTVALDAGLARGGRPRSKEREREILAAALHTLVTEGFDAMTIEGVAAAAGAGKATVYRRWHNKIDLVIDAIGEQVALRAEIVDTGDIGADMRSYLRQLQRDLLGPNGALLATFMAERLRHPALAEAFEAQYASEKRACLRKLVRSRSRTWHASRRYRYRLAGRCRAGADGLRVRATRWTPPTRFAGPHRAPVLRMTFSRLATRGARTRLKYVAVSRNLDGETCVSAALLQLCDGPVVLDDAKFLTVVEPSHHHLCVRAGSTWSVAVEVGSGRPSRKNTEPPGATPVQPSRRNSSSRRSGTWLIQKQNTTRS